jgi:hypothetical protein
VIAQLQVRCCCDPAKLLGWVTVDASQVYEGNRIQFLLRTEYTLVRLAGNDLYIRQPAVLELEVASWESGCEFGTFTGGLALRSDDTPLELLRRIPSWVEAPDTLH